MAAKDWLIGTLRPDGYLKTGLPFASAGVLWQARRTGGNDKRDGNAIF